MRSRLHDQISGGTRFQTLTVVDVFSGEVLAIEVGQRLKAEHVVKVLNRLVRQHDCTRAKCSSDATALRLVA